MQTIWKKYQINFMPKKHYQPAGGVCSSTICQTGKRKKNMLTSRWPTWLASPPVGLVRLAVIVSPANETQPCQLRLYIVLINEERIRVHLDESVCFFGYRGTTKSFLIVDIQQIVSNCFCQIEAKLANVTVATYYWLLYCISARAGCYDKVRF